MFRCLDHSGILRTHDDSVNWRHAMMGLVRGSHETDAPTQLKRGRETHEGPSHGYAERHEKGGSRRRV